MQEDIIPCRIKRGIRSTSYDCCSRIVNEEAKLIILTNAVLVLEPVLVQGNLQ